MSNMQEQNCFNGSEIAIIGMDGRFPGARNIVEFWNNLCNKVESITYLGDEELKASGVSKAELDNCNYVKARPILDGLEYFDAPFFGIPPNEARIMDPQQRISLECAWSALENAGYNPEEYKGNIGVFAGAKMNTYIFNLLSNQDVLKSNSILQLIVGNDLAFLSTRISYKLNLRGPSYTVLTACSTSLVAVHMACQSLLMDECQIALAGGVTVDVPHRVGYIYQEGGIFSPDGHCRPFDAKAQGTTFGSGLGFVVLKRLEDAINDKDYIYAVIKGSATNNDGSQKASYSAPSVEGQTRVIIDALTYSGVSPDTITYIETHGTGTPLGDPIEILALTNAYRAYTERKGYCAIGSVKSNIGHLDAASGIVSLIKTTMGLDKKLIPPSLNYNEPNPKIDFDSSPFYVNKELTKWEKSEFPRRGAVSSFGFGGTNTHVVLEEAPLSYQSRASRSWQLMTFSAKTQDALKRNMSNMADFLSNNSSYSLADVAYTLKVGRKNFEYRNMFICRDTDDVVDILKAPDSKRICKNSGEPGQKSVVFMFPGQGSQYVNMTREIYNTETVFRIEVEKCCEILKNITGFDLRDVLYVEETCRDEAELMLKKTIITQPVLFTIEYALAKLLISWGIYPKAMIGHSLGEYTAACISGVMTLETALSLIAARSKLMQQLQGGVMLSVSLPESELISIIGDKVSLAAVNGPSLCVVSGDAEAVCELEKILLEQGVNHRRLHTSHAFHSKMMEPVIGDFKEIIQGFELLPPKFPYISNLTGTWIKEEEAVNPDYWASHMRETVRFADGIASIFKLPGKILLEVGPGTSLCTFVRQCHAGDIKTSVFPTVRHPMDRQPDMAFLLNTVGLLWLEGAKINWKEFYRNEERFRVPIPSYSFEKHRYWVEPGETVLSDAKLDTNIKKNIKDWFYQPIWKQTGPLTHFLKTDNFKNRDLKWLIFDDIWGFGKKTANLLKENGQSAVLVYPGNGFTDDGGFKYTINPCKYDDYSTLVNVLAKNDRFPRKIIYFWGITDKVNYIPASSETIDIAQAQFFNGLTYISKAIGESDVKERVTLGVVSNNMHDVIGGEYMYPEKALLLGPCKVIPQEYFQISCVSIDLADKDSIKGQEDSVIKQAINDMCCDLETEGMVIAYRNNYRWVKCYEVLSLDGHEELSLIKEGEVYLITGGLGGVGLVLARYFAERKNVKLVLLSRSRFPHKDEWDNYLDTYGHQDVIGKKIFKLMEIESRGSEVLIVDADVACKKQMKIVIEDVKKRFGKISGVIHAAGVSAIEMISMKTQESLNKALAPKVKGTLVLNELLKDMHLDFFILCSSTAAVIGSFGQVDYCAANAYLDAFSHYTNFAGGINTLSINWDVWSEVGMNSNISLLKEYKGSISPAEGVEVFRLALGSGLPQLITSTSDLNSVIKQLKMKKERSNEVKDKKRDESGNEECISYDNAIEESVAKAWEKTLGIDNISTSDNFFELGGDSIKAIQISAYLQEQQLKLEIGDLLQYPTIKEVSSYVIHTNKKTKPESVDNNTVGSASEFSYKSLSSDELNAIKWYISKNIDESVEITDIYPLTSTQEKILFYSLFYKGTGIYLESFSFELNGEVDISLFEESFRFIIKRYDIFRTVFTFRKVKKPLQIVLNDREAGIHYEDISHLDENKINKIIEEFKEKDRNRGFSLAKDLLMRMAIFKTCNKTYKIIWNYHHILMEGWSIGIIIRELLEYYRGLKKNRPARFDKVHPFSNYINWLEKQDKNEAYAYWRKYLNGYIASDSLGKFRKKGKKESYKSAQYSFVIDKGVLKVFLELSVRNRVTLNSIFQSAWGLLLQIYNGVNDIVLGMAVSVRPSEIEGVEKMVGLFVNAVPIRIKCESGITFEQLSRVVQDSVISSEKYRYLSVMELQENMGLKQNIVDHVIAFENYPVYKEIEDLGRFKESFGFLVENIVLNEQTHFDLSIMILPGNEYTIILNYNSSAFEEEFSGKIEKDFKSIINEIVKGSDIELMQIKKALEKQMLK